MMTLNDWFEKGMTTQEYIVSMQVNREEMMGIYDRFSLSPEVRPFYEGLREKQLRAVILTADWCGDAMLCVPILMRLAEAAGFDLRFLIRDENLELMDQYLTNGRSRSIPIFIFIDPAGEERAVWGPRAPEVQQLVEEMRASLPPKEDPQFEEKQRAMYRSFKERLLEDRSLWDAVERSIRSRLKDKLGQ